MIFEDSVLNNNLIKYSQQKASEKKRGIIFKDSVLNNNLIKYSQLYMCRLTDDLGGLDHR